MDNDPVLRNASFGDTARIQFHIGFLELDKKMQVDYNKASPRIRRLHQLVR